MKKLLFLMIIICAAAALKAQVSDTSQISYPNFNIYYCNSTANAKVVYTLYKPQLLSQVKTARDPKFHSTGNRPNLTEVYVHSGYDIGHYYSAKNGRYNPAVEHQTFDFANTRPQNHNCNAYRVFPEENYERVEAIKYDSLKVIAWDTGSLGKLGGKVNIPEYCWKKLIYRDSTVIFKMPNCDTVMKHDWYWYKIKSK
jgi:DNA/RNA endonuclease G (NUC1)